MELGQRRSENGEKELVVDWAKEEAKMARIFRNIHVYW